LVVDSSTLALAAHHPRRKMETCVLIPQEFSLVLTTTNVDRNANKLSEMRVNVWSNSRLPQGTVVYPFQGTIRLDKLEVYSYLDEGDVSTQFIFIFGDFNE